MEPWIFFGSNSCQVSKATAFVDHYDPQMLWCYVGTFDLPRSGTVNYTECKLHWMDWNVNYPRSSTKA